MRAGLRHLVGRRQLGAALVAGVAGDEAAVRQLVEPLVELHTRVHLRRRHVEVGLYWPGTRQPLGCWTMMYQVDELFNLQQGWRLFLSVSAIRTFMPLKPAWRLPGSHKRPDQWC